MLWCERGLSAAQPPLAFMEVVCGVGFVYIGSVSLAAAYVFRIYRWGFWEYIRVVGGWFWIYVWIYLRYGVV